MRSRTLLALAAILLAQGAAAAQGAEPPRPPLPRNADPNDWEAYYDRGTDLLRTVPQQADQYLYWAQRLNPARAEPLYAHWVALHLQNVRRWDAYMHDDPRVVDSPEIIRMDSLLLRAQIRNPFLHRGLVVLLYGATSPSVSDTKFNRGLLQYFSGRLDLAVHTLSQYVEHDPRNLNARWSLVLALVSSGQMDSAQAAMDTLVARLRERDETRVVKVYESKELQEYASGLLALARNHPAEARAAMEQAIVENAASWYAHRGRAMALRVEQRPDEAAQEMAAALELAPEDALLRYDYGVALLEARRPAEAAAQFRRAVKLEPYWADAWLGLGDGERMAGHAAEAIAAYEQYLALAPRGAAATVQAVRDYLERLRQPAAAPAP
ncbi:MAG TPA: tetratricopeptide repeat protein [Longimicrobium sp.]|nr:tetratricopeptide repeat protein [Longimicrobium sp.]